MLSQERLPAIVLDMNISNRELFFEDFAKVFKVLSSPVRLKLFNFISFSPRTVEDCAIKFNQSNQNMSLHLMSMLKAGILQVEQIKNFRFYSLAESGLPQQINQMLLTSQVQLVDSHLEASHDFEKMAKAALAGRVSLIDLREHSERAYLPFPHSYHFDGSLKDISEYLKKEGLAKKELVLFCKGRMCERLASFANGLAPKYNIKTLSLSSFELEDLISHF